MKLPASAARFVLYTPITDGQRYVVASGDKRAGRRGTAVAILGLRHASGYEVILRMDDGKQDSFAPMSLMPELQPQSQGASHV